MTRPLGVVVALTLALLSAACSSGDGDDAPASGARSVPSAASPATSSAPPTTALAPGADPFAIPDAIDAAYVNRVLEALYAIDGDITREVLATRGVSFDPVKRLGAIYGEPQLMLELGGLPSVLRDAPAIYRTPPGDRRVTVLSMLKAQRDCIVAVADLSYADVLITPTTLGRDETFIIVLTASDRVEETPNPTPWLIVGSRIMKSTEVVESEITCA